MKNALKKYFEDNDEVQIGDYRFENHKSDFSDFDCQKKSFKNITV